MPVVNGFRIAHLNCRSFLLHKEEVFSLMHDYHFDVLALSETWLDDTVSDVEVLPPGCECSLLRQDRNWHGGGVAFLISNYIRYCRREFHGGHVETLWMELYPQSKRSLLLCCA